MSRACGKNPCNASKPNFVRKAPKDWEYGHSDSHGGFGALSARYKGYVPRKRDSEIPKLRTRKSGVVGPELDLSVRYSNVPLALWENIRLSAPKEVRDYMRIENPHDDPDNYQVVATPKKNGKMSYRTEYSRHYAETRPQKGCVRTWNWSDKLVRHWTNFCHHYGVRYRGDRDYDFPKGLCAKASVHKYAYYFEPVPWPKTSGGDRYDSFYFKKASGLITHKRSEAALIKRALRGKREAAIKPLRADQVFVRRPTLSAKQIRSSYQLSGKQIPFREYVSLCKRDTVLTLAPPRCRSTIPGIVFESLRRIYSHPQRCERPWFGQSGLTDGLKYALEFQVPQIRRSTQTLDYRLRDLVNKHGGLVFVRAHNSDAPWGYHPLDHSLQTRGLVDGIITRQSPAVERFKALMREKVYLSW